MSENKLIRLLVLRTVDIVPSAAAPCVALLTAVDNDYGTCTANCCVITWKNVNIRTCLGELYNKYNRFNLKMTAAQIRHNTAGATVDSQFMIHISGLPFSSGSTYNTRLGPSNQAVLGCVYFFSTVSTGVTTSLLSGLVTFDKPLQDSLNITLELKNSSLTSITMTNFDLATFKEKIAVNLGHWSIVCDIYGIE